MGRENPPEPPDVARAPTGLSRLTALLRPRWARAAAGAAPAAVKTSVGEVADRATATATFPCRNRRMACPSRAATGLRPATATATFAYPATVAATFLFPMQGAKQEIPY
jgi:hypothetical protein